LGTNKAFAIGTTPKQQSNVYRHRSACILVWRHHHYHRLCHHVFEWPGGMNNGSICRHLLNRQKVAPAKKYKWCNPLAIYLPFPSLLSSSWQECYKASKDCTFQ
jgi:hypothetical protein